MIESAVNPANRSLVFAFGGLALWIVAVTQADFSHMGKLGLISVLGWPYFAGLTLVAIGIVLELFCDPVRDSRVTVLIIVLIIFIFGTACAVEPTSALPDSWVHAGFIQYILQNGHILNGYDSRFSWPGGFSLGAVLAAFTGQPNALSFLRWFPLFIELLYLAPVLVIARFSSVSRRTGWLGVVLFYATNWIYQDYFSPQALNYLFFLVVLAVVLACMRPIRHPSSATAPRTLLGRAAQQWNRLAHRRSSEVETVPVWSNRVILTCLALAGLICLASAMSHQLTPYALILALTACFLTRRLGRPELIVIAGLLAVGWLSLGASNYWIGHLHDIFGSAGQISSTIGSNVTSRIAGSPSHRFVIDARLLITAALYSLAGIGVLRRRPNTRTLEALAAAPFFLLAAQNYGGEGLLRVVLFGLPFTSLLAASALLPTPRVALSRPPRSRRRNYRYGRIVTQFVVFVVLLSFALATTLARGGNDAYESFSTGELAAVNYAYSHARAGQVIGMVAPFLPFGQVGVGSTSVFVAAGGGTPSLGAVRSALVTFRPEWIILSQSQEAWGEIVAGYPVGWEFSLVNSLATSGYRVVKGWPTATVLEVIATPTVRPVKPAG